MKYRINGQEVTEAEVREAIREAIPKGGVEFLENAIRTCRQEGMESITLHVGTKKTIEIMNQIGG